MIELLLLAQLATSDLVIPEVEFVPKVEFIQQETKVPWYKNEKRIWLLIDMAAAGGDLSVTSHCIGAGECVEANGLIKFIEKYPTAGGITKTLVDGIVMWVITEVFDRNKVWGRILYATDIGISVLAMTINNKRLGRIGQ